MKLKIFLLTLFFVMMAFNTAVAPAEAMTADYVLTSPDGSINVGSEYSSIGTLKVGRTDQSQSFDIFRQVTVTVQHDGKFTNQNTGITSNNTLSYELAYKSGDDYVPLNNGDKISFPAASVDAGQGIEIFAKLTGDIADVEPGEYLNTLNFTSGIDIISVVDENTLCVFGNYNGNPLQWRVLSVDAVNKRALLVTQDCVATMKYQASNLSNKWSGSDVKPFLNGTGDNQFLKEAFTDAERNMLLSVNIDDNDESYVDPNGTYKNSSEILDPSGLDKVFLLSVADVKPISQGGYFGNKDLVDSDNSRVARFNGSESCWWLRSPGMYFSNTYYAAYARTDGHIHKQGNKVNYYDYGVRPAVWLDLSVTEENGPQTVTAGIGLSVYEISYDLAGGEVETANPTRYDITTAMFTLNNPTKTGYTFAGWTGTGITEASTSVTVTKGSTGERSYTATWTINQYSITFDSNGGSAVQAITQDYSSDITAPANPTKTGYTFTGWTPDIPAKIPAENLTVQAQWQANKYSVKFESNGGTGSMEAQDFTYDAEQALNGNRFTRTGCTFNGWKDNDNNKTYNGGESVKNLTATDGGVITLYAQWKVNQYTLTFDTDGGNEISPMTLDYGADITAPADPTRTGYTFTGWDKTIPSAMPAENQTFTAQWEATKYAITYNLDGGTNNPDNPAEYTIDDSITLKDPAKENYDFKGWTPEGVINKGSTGEKTFSANFVIISVSEDVKSEDTKSEDIESGDVESDDTKNVTSNDETIRDIENILSGDETLSKEDVDKVISKLETLSDDATLNSKEAETLVKSILGNENSSSGASKLSNEQIETVANAIVDGDGKIDGTVMETLTDSLAKTDTATGETTLTANDLTGNSTAAKMAVAALTSSVGKSENKELNLESVPLTSTEGISELIKKVAEGSGNETKDLTLNLSKNDGLETIDNLEGVSLQEMTLTGNNSVKEIKLDATTDIKELNANGAENLTEVEIAGNANIETLDISGTDVSSLNAEDCEKLENLTVEGDEDNGGALQDLNLEGCKNIKNLSVSNNKLLGVKKPSTLNNSNITFKARGQKRSGTEFKLSRKMNMWEFLWGVWQSSLEDDDENKAEYNPENRSKAPFDVANIISVNGVTPDENGDVEFPDVPVSLTYEYDPGFNTVGTGSFMAADDDPESGMDVTIDTSSDDGSSVSGSGGGCNSVRSEELGIRSVLMFLMAALAFELLLKKREIKKI